MAIKTFPVLLEIDSYDINQQRRKWLIANVGDRRKKWEWIVTRHQDRYGPEPVSYKPDPRPSSINVYTFNEELDAILFSMRWGGKSIEKWPYWNFFAKLKRRK
jgi:hypothetical protein